MSDSKPLLGDRRAAPVVWIVTHDSGAGDGGYTVPGIYSTLEKARAVVKEVGGEIERVTLDAEPYDDDAFRPETPRA